MSKKLYFAVMIGILAGGLAWLSGCEKGNAVSSISQKNVAAVVNGQSITTQDIDAKIAKLPPYYQQMLKDRKKELLDDMILESLLYKEAKKKGLENDKDVKEMLDEAYKKIIITKYIQGQIDAKTAVSDKDTEDYYNAHKDEFMMPERIKASHILVKTEEDAKAVLNDLAAGKSFEDLAKERSQDSSAKKGGDLGYFTKGQMVPEFEEAAWKLEAGQVSGVVKTQFGYHVIKVTDRKPAQQQDLKGVSAKIKNTLLSQKKQEAFNKLIGELKSKASITVNDSLFPAPKTNLPGGPAPMTSRPGAAQAQKAPVAPAAEASK